MVLYCSSSEPVHRLSSLSLCGLTVCRSDLIDPPTPFLPSPSSPFSHHSTTPLQSSQSRTHSSNKARAVSLCGLSNMKPLHPHPITFLSPILYPTRKNREATAWLKKAVPRLSTDLLVTPYSQLGEVHQDRDHARRHS